MNKVAISADGACDLPQKIVKESEINLIHFDILTDAGNFKDSVEITEKNILEYMMGGNHKAQSCPPSTAEYKRYFKALLKKNDEIVHIAMGAGISDALNHASLARAQLGIDGQRIHIYDSHQLSSGIGFFVLEALKLKNEGCGAKEMVARMKKLDNEVYTSFITRDADFLYYNGRVPTYVMTLSKKFSIHPVLHVKDGELKLKKLIIGNYENACNRYIKGLVKRNSNIDLGMAFLTYAGVSLAQIDSVENKVKKYISFSDFYKQPACATISANCGPGSFGIIVKKKSEL